MPQVKNLEEARQIARLEATGGDERVQGPSCNLGAGPPSPKTSTRRTSTQFCSRGDEGDEAAEAYPMPCKLFVSLR